MKMLILTTALLLSNFANAALLDLGASTGNKGGVEVVGTATTNVNGQALALVNVGSGTRIKKTIIGTIPVYVVQLFALDAATVTKTDGEMLGSLSAQPVSAVRLTFVRDVPANTVAESFLDAFDANGIDTNDADIVAFTDLVNAGGAASNMGSLTIVTVKNPDGTETVSYGNQVGGNEKVGKALGAAGFGQKIMSIWLGVPADDGLKALKAELLQ